MPDDLLNTLHEIVNVSLAGMKPTPTQQNTVSLPKHDDSLAQCARPGCLYQYCENCRSQYAPYCSQYCQDEMEGLGER